jgi:hypothetical protein
MCGAGHQRRLQAESEGSGLRHDCSHCFARAGDLY